MRNARVTRPPRPRLAAGDAEVVHRATMKLYRTVITCLALVSATGYAEKPTADEIQKYLAFFEKFAATIVADKDDCGKMATDANALLDANQALLKTAQAQQGQMKDLSK